MASQAAGQFACPDPQWKPGSTFGGTDFRAFVVKAWDPDGPGPQESLMVFGGEFGYAGGLLTGGIAAYDRESGMWSPLGKNSGLAWVRAIEPWVDGRLVAAGDFDQASGLNVQHIAYWDGATWNAIGAGLPDALGGVFSLTVLPNGELVAGGTFKKVGEPIEGTMRWNGSAWVSMGMTLGFGGGSTVYALAARPNGDVIAGGDFVGAGPTNAGRIARWDGATWHGMGGIGPSSPSTRVESLLALSNGDVIAAGTFETAGGVNCKNIARWNGTSWSTLGSGVGNIVKSMTLLPNGDLLVSRTPVGLSNVTSMGRWNGSSWAAYGPPFLAGEIWSMAAAADGEVYTAGSMTATATTTLANVARGNGAEWFKLGLGFDDKIRSLAALPGGDLVVAGEFTVAGKVKASRVAIGDGVDWTPLGAGVNGTVLTTAVRPTGEVIVGGSFTEAGGSAAQRIAQWDGVSWSSFGAGMSGSNPNLTRVNSLLLLPNSDLIAGGRYTSAGGQPASSIARWNGSAWSPLSSGMGGPDPIVMALAELNDGTVVAGGTFTTAGGVDANNMAQWDGATWKPLGLGANNTVSALQPLPNGDLLVGGFFDAAGGMPGTKYIARWNGINWTPLGLGLDGQSSNVSAILPLSNGDILAGGNFPTAGGKPANGIARWNGVEWFILPGAGVDQVTDLLLRADGDVAVSAFQVSLSGVAVGPLVRYGCEQAACYPDCDLSGSLNIDDFVCFQTVFALGDPAADCDQSGSLNIDDFVCFQTSFAVGC